MRYNMYVDANGNGVLDEGDVIIDDGVVRTLE